MRDDEFRRPLNLLAAFWITLLFAFGCGMLAGWIAHGIVR